MSPSKSKKSKKVTGSSSSAKDLKYTYPSSKPGVGRLIKRSGILRHSNDLAVTTNLFMKEFTEHVLRHVLAIVQNQKVKTISNDHVKYGYEHLTGLKLYNADVTKACDKPPKLKSGVDAMKDVRFYAKQHECLFLQKGPFGKFAKITVENIIGHGNGTAKFKKESMSFLQSAVEEMTVHMLNGALVMSIHAGRKTVNDEDFKNSSYIVSSITGKKFSEIERGVETAINNKMGMMMMKKNPKKKNASKKVKAVSKSPSKSSSKSPSSKSSSSFSSPKSPSSFSSPKSPSSFSSPKSPSGSSSESFSESENSSMGEEEEEEEEDEDFEEDEDEEDEEDEDFEEDEDEE